MQTHAYRREEATGMTDDMNAQLTAAGNEMSASFLAAKKRSDETLAKLKANPGKFTMLTGDRPTGRLHLGHFFGSIRERVAMQNLGVNTNIIIADYQVITDRDTTEHIDDNVLNLVLDYMAAGIDPEKTMIFTHSAVPAENQLMLPFLSLVTEAELHRNPTVKSEMESSGHALTGLLLTYPVHQACDILFCKANVVPIGKDNLPHVEITRTIARRFNERYAKKNPVFPEPAAILSEAPEIPGLDGRKMSKSAPIREALRELENEGLVEYVRNAGCSVKEITFEESFEIYLMRANYEIMAVRLLGGKIPEETLQEMEEILERMKSLNVDEYDQLFSYDNKFHSCLIRMTGMKSLYKAWKSLNYGNIVTGYNLASDKKAVIKRQYPIHKELLEACKSRKKEEICRVLSDHYMGTIHRLLKEQGMTEADTKFSTGLSDFIKKIIVDLESMIPGK